MTAASMRRKTFNDDNRPIMETIRGGTVVYADNEKMHVSIDGRIYIIRAADKNLNYPVLHIEEMLTKP